MGLSLVAVRASSDAKAYTGRELTGLAQAAGYSALRWGPAGVRGQLLVARR